ncbi:hypothetical protein Tco_0651769 [Tanacetum coccineum]|uniref:Uncharacterized protein n=1 Tax=Tanacetum coccineum TaxID=301880 RepID=A0ABQ4WVW7_9ASTR
MPPTTAEEKALKRLEVKARSTLMIDIPNEHQLKFNLIKDAKLLIEVLVSQLELLGETISQEDVNQKLLRSLSPEWNTHVVVWRNKTDLDTMSMVDLYNNLKVYEPEVNGMSSSSSITQNMDFVSSSNNNNSSTNGAVSTANGVSAANTQVNASNIDNLSDVVICAFLASQLNNPQLAHEELQQIHPDDLEEMDLRCPKWSATTATRRDILLRNAELQEIKITRTRKAQEGLYIAIRELRKKLEIAQKEKDGIQFNIDKFENASKSLNKLIESQIVENSKKGLGYNTVPPLYTGNFMPPTPDLSFTGLDE